METFQLRLTEGFLLLALDKKKGKFLTDAISINHGLAGTVLLKLSILKKIKVSNKKVQIIDNTSTGVDYLDELFGYIRKAKKEHKVKFWIHRIASKLKKLKYDVLSNLVERGILMRKRKKFLGLIPYTVYPTLDPGPEDEMKQHLVEVINGRKKMDEKSLMMLSLAEATKLARVLFSSRKEYKHARKRIKKLAKDFEVSTAVQETIKEVCSVVITATTSAAIAATSSGSS